MINLFKNKRGDTSIVLLVCMVFLLCASALFFFVIANGSYEKKIANIGLINSLYSEKAVLEYSMIEVSRDILKDNPHISASEFIISFKQKYLSANISESIDDRWLVQIVSNAYDVKIKDKNLKFVLKDFIFSKQYEVFEGQEITSASYKTDISFDLVAQ
jgi:hypothetical protein